MRRTTTPNRQNVLKPMPRKSPTVLLATLLCSVRKAHLWLSLSNKLDRKLVDVHQTNYYGKPGHPSKKLEMVY